MIKDNLKNAKLYYSISENLKKGFEWLQNMDLNTIEDGRYVVDGDKVYANVQTYETKKEAKYEAHRNYIDIQYIVSGSELVGVTALENCHNSDGYNPETDLEFMESRAEDEYQTLRVSEFLVLFPTDAHKPSMFDGENKNVKKVVVKVRVF